MKVEFDFTRFFGDKKLKDVFQKIPQEDTKNINLVFDSKKIELSNYDIVCMGIEDIDAVGDDIIEELVNKRVYIITTPEIRDGLQKVLLKQVNRQRGYWVIHEEKKQKGNYLILKNSKQGDNIKSFYFCKGNCIEIKNFDSVKDLYKLFINKFYGTSDNEYTSINNNRERVEIAFDIPPFISSDNLIINQGLNPGSRILGKIRETEIIFSNDPVDNLEKFNQLKKYFFTTKQNNQTYSNITRFGKECYFTDTKLPSLFLINGCWYLLNCNVNDLAKNTGYVFLINICKEEDYPFNDVERYIFKSQIDYKDAAVCDIWDKEIKNVIEIKKDFTNDQTITISNVDLHEFIGKNNNYKDWEKLLSENETKFTGSDYKSVKVNFIVNIQSKMKSFSEEWREVKGYKEFGDFCKKVIKDGDSFIKGKLSQVNEKIKSLKKKFEKQKEAKNKDKDENVDPNSEEITKLEEEHKRLINDQAKYISWQSEMEKRIEKGLDNKSGCKNVWQEIIDKLISIGEEEKRIKLPTFPNYDIPKNGKIYEKGNNLEYVVDDSNLDNVKNAIDEVKEWDIFSRISFVSRG